MNNSRSAQIVATFLLTGMLAFGGAVPMLAEANHMDELRVKVGSTVAAINGEKQSINKPYIQKGTMMVPLGVFKKTFNSQIKLSGNDVVKIMDGPHTVALTIGSSTAWIDGKKVEMSAAPEMKQGVLMVPLRPVAQGLGASIQKNPNGELVVRLKGNDNEDADHEQSEDGIDADVGKTKIGNSYYGWSMNYPTGLVVGSSYDGSEDYINFMDAEGAYYFEILVNAEEVKLDADDMLQQLVQEAKSMGETVMDREAYPNAPTPYARIVTKDTEGTFWEVRQYYDNGRLYEIYFSDNEASNYKDLQKYAPLLNSFKTSFNTSDRSVKDLSTVEDGMTTAYNQDYGIGLTVPAEWSKDNQNMVYESKKGTHLSLQVTSAPQGASVKDWSNQLAKWMKDVFVTDAYREMDSYTAKVAGKDAQINKFEYNFGDGWTTEYNVLIQENGYRYYLEYAVPEKAGEEMERFDSILKSLEIDFETVTENFGRLGEDPYLIDKSKSVTRSSKKYGYSLDIPRFWTPLQDQYERSKISYQFTGGYFSIQTNEEISVELAVSQMKESYEEAGKSRKDFRLVGTESITFAGQPATSFTYHEVENGVPHQGKQILFEHKGITYTITSVINDANRTEVQKSALDHALESFSFNE
ncbi:stalk domain-containing protein [Paenibacillus gallinarum]|uniref:Copper amine oxidase N-terminal domain-containing protein n=1 Tax=Paenibacillus gallinarum TaxID=2762232 RepID=A0ABR8SZI2_9BACL|nr:stalk domain-containing protein [Paenibacillus gallinarum]MBD7968905.1 copper amine oxidase N-terminal domain-containing protein [Paenibacillus gallinarum]